MSFSRHRVYFRSVDPSSSKFSLIDTKSTNKPVVCLSCMYYWVRWMHDATHCSACGGSIHNLPRCAKRNIETLGKVVCTDCAKNGEL